MQGFICNKCNAPWYRGKTPFSITQCGHIYCLNCIKQAERKCAQCENANIVSVPLEEPLREPKIAGYFEPLADSLATLQKVQAFQSNQSQILAQRFYDIDKKYESLKTQYVNTVRHCKVIHEKYQKLKAEKESLEKRLKQLAMQNTPPTNSSDISTPYSGNSRPRYAVSLQFTGSQTGSRRLYSATTRKTEADRNAEEFRVPRMKPPRSVGTYIPSDIGSVYSISSARDR